MLNCILLKIKKEMQLLNVEIEQLNLKCGSNLQNKIQLNT